MNEKVMKYVKAEQYWKNSAHAASYTPEATSAKAVLENQTMKSPLF